MVLRDGQYVSTGDVMLGVQVRYGGGGGNDGCGALLPLVLCPDCPARRPPLIPRAPTANPHT